MLSDILFISHPHAIWIVAAEEDRILASNPAALQLLGVEAARMAGLKPGGIGLVPDAAGHARIGAPGDPAIEVALAEHAIDWEGAAARMLIARPVAEDLPVAEVARLAARDRMLKRALDLGHLGVMEVEPATGMVRSTPEILALLGIGADQAEIAYDKVMSTVHPDDLEGYEAARDAAYRAGRLLDTTVRVNRHDGAVRHIRVIGASGVENGREVRRSVVQDVTELVALRKAAAQLAERLQSVIDSMPSPFFLLGRDLGVLYVNAAGRYALAEGRGREVDPIGRHVWDVFPELKPDLGAEFDALLNGGPPVTTTIHLPQWDSHFRIEAFATSDGIAAHARNVTNRVRAEQALRESEERFRLAMQASREVIFDWDIVNDKLVWSEAARVRYGYDPAVFPGTLEGWLSRVHPDDRARMSGAIEVNRRGDHVGDLRQDEYRLLRADDSIAHVIDRCIAVYDDSGTPVRLVGSMIDVTDIRHEDARMRAVVEVAADAIFEYDPSRRMMIFSEGISTVFGHGWVGEQPVPSPWRAALHPEDRERVLAEFRAFSRSTETRFRHEYRMRRGDGAYAHVREKIVALRDETGRGIWFIGSLDDVTTEREAEDRLRQAERIEAIGKLTGGVAHDFNNLLTVILGNAELLSERAGLDAEGRRMAGSVLTAAERGAELTRALLSFARKQPLAPRALNAADVMAQLRGLLVRTLPASIDLRIVVRPDDWLIEADPSQMNAALLNLAVNARDSMPDGGSLTLECANARLDDRYVALNPEASAGDFLRISVSDTGTGMTPDVVARAREPFFTTKPPGAGSGIGLSMVHGFVRQSGGHMCIYSEPGAGTTISLYLPRSAAAEAGTTDQVAAEALPLGAGQHVLVVEDNDALRRHVVDLVGGLGYRVSAAADAAEALALLRAAGPVDLLFTDVVMPGEMNGPMLARAALGEFPALRVLFTSGYTEDAIVHHGRLDAGVQLLSKPYRRQDLATKLHEVLGAPATPPLDG